MQDFRCTDRPLSSGRAMLEASAGTGKTYSICSIYLGQLLVRGRTPEQILVVTFTKAAARELKSRIHARILDLRDALAAYRALDQSQRAAFADGQKITQDWDLLEAWDLLASEEAIEQTAARLALACASFDLAPVSTIHGFCQNVLAQNSLSAGLPASIAIAPAQDEELLRAARDFWRSHVSCADGSALSALALEILRISPGLAVSIQGPESLAQIARLAPHHPDIQGCDTCRLLLPGPANAPELESAWQALRAAVDADIEKVYSLKGKVFPATQHIFRGEACDRCHRLMALLASSECEGPEGFGRFRAACLEQNEQPLALLGLFAPGTLKVKSGKELPDLSLPAACRDFCRSAEKFAADFVRRVWDEVAPAAQMARTGAGAITFDDMLVLTERLVGNPAAASRIRAQYPVALIDEFQDTDALQYSIFDRVYPAGGADSLLIFVGDPKQSIYSFRNSDLEIYRRARETVPEDRIYQLADNWRSSKAMIAAANALFAATAPQSDPRLWQACPQIHFPAGKTDEPPAHAFPEGHPEAGLVLLETEAADKAKMEEVRSCALESMVQQIQALLACGWAPGDMAVLVGTNDLAELVVKALSEIGIATALGRKVSVLSSQQAQELLAVVRVWSEPASPELFKGALIQPFFGLQERVACSLVDDDATFPAVAEAFASAGRDAQVRGIAAALVRLAGDIAALAQDSGMARLACDQAGARILTNIDHLVDLIMADPLLAFSPVRTLRWLETHLNQGDSSASEDEMLRPETDEKLLTVMTMHGSKGLEFPIVFCPFPKANSGKSGGPVVGHRILSGAPQTVVDLREQKSLAAEEKTGDGHPAEALRLFYVMATRAKYRCYLCTPRVLVQEASPFFEFVAAASADPLHPRQAFCDTQPLTACEAAERIAAGTGSVISLPACETVPGGSRGTGHEILCAAPLPAAPMRSAWTLSSFSKMTQGLSLAADHDEGSQQENGQTESADAPAWLPLPIPENDILRLRLGVATETGTLIHSLFERLDYQEPSDEALLEQIRWKLEAAKTTDEQNRTLLAMFRAVTRAPVLAGFGAGYAGFSLSDVPRSERLNEMEFSMGAHVADPQALRRELDQAGFPMPASLDVATVRGFLTGSIDLVFRHAGKFWIIDWKSNQLLGDLSLGLAAAQAAYCRAGIRESIRQHCYGLQAAIYQCALHRYLKGRLGQGYDYERDFGGVLYVYVRGVRPGWVEPLRGRSLACGVYEMGRLSKAQMERIEGLVCAEACDGI